MKKNSLWTLGAAAAFLCGLSACSDTISSDEEIYENGSVKSSSSTKDKEGKSSAKEEKSSSSKQRTSCDTISSTLAAPTDLNVVKNGDNRWIVLWNYVQADNRPEESFVIEVLNMSDSSPKWKTLDSTSADVTMYNLVGESKAGKYYRILAKDQCGTSKPTDMIQVSTAGSGSTSASAELAIPTNLKLDTLGNNQWQLSWSYQNNTNRPENGFQLQVLDLNAESPTWKNDATTNKGVYIIKIDGTKKGGLIYHVAAKDSNGVSEYSSEIRIPSATDNETSTNSDNEIAIPTSLKLDSTNVNTWKLSWLYTNNKANPENGFVLQALNLEATDGVKWKDITTVNQGVHYILLKSTTYGGQYIRVAAKNADGKQRSTYSEEILIPKAISENASNVAANDTLAVPSALKMDSIGENKWKLTWSYTNNAIRPENGFIIETYNLDNPGKWTKAKELFKGVHSYTFEVTSTDPMMLIHVLAKDEEGTSEYSEGIQIPGYKDYNVPPPTIELSIPTNLKLDSINPGKYQLTWDYTDNKDRPENGFVLQSMKPGDNNWTDNAATTKQGVHVIVIDALANNKANSGKFYRVAAIDKEGKLSDYSKEIQVPIVTDDGTSYSSTDKTPLAVPTNLAVEDLGSNKYKITWGYTNNENRPETKGFVLQKLDASATSPQWKDAGTTNKGVHFIVVTVSADDPEMTYRVAAKDSRGLSEYSATIVVPKYSPNAVADGCSGEFVVPSGLTPERIAPNVWRLVWNYNQNSKCKEEKFVIQKVDVKEKLNGEWEIIGTVPRNVHYMNLEGEDNLNFVYRVAAVRGDDTTKYSNEEILTRSTKYSDEYPFSTPKVKAKVFYTATITGTVVTVNTVEFMLIVEGNYPNHAMLYSDYTKQFDYQFRWNGENEADWKTVVVKNDGEYQTTLSKEYNGADKIKEFCRSYASVRTIWTQNDTDASKDYTEWSDPIGPLYGSVSTTFTYTGVDGDGNEVTKSIDVCK